MLPDMKHPAYHKDNHQSQQKEDRTAQSIGDRQPSAAFFRLVLTDTWRSRTVMAQKSPPSRPILESW